MFISNTTERLILAKMFVKTIVFLLLGSLSIQEVVSTCPNNEFIQPCTCKTAAFGNHILCSFINSTEVIKEIFGVLSDYEINTLLFNGLRITTPLPSNTFQRMKIENLRFTDSIISFRTDEPPFRGLEDTLKTLDFLSSEVQGGLVTLRLTHLRRLTEMNANFVILNHIGGEWFQDGPISVKILKLSHNEIQEIDSNAFSGLIRLESLSLADNKLRTISRDVLPMPANYLKWIDLSFNKLNSLPEDFFSGMTSIKRIILSGNQFQTLPRATWQIVWRDLEHLFIKDNPIVCDSEIRWAYEQGLPKHLEGTCKSPADMAGRELSTLSVDSLPS